MLNRREFIRNSAWALGAVACPDILRAAGKTKTLTILHTNDTHSRLDPFPLDGGKYQGLGGVVARSEIIRLIREKEEHVLLFDAGDVFQGTPYFNLYKGEPEMKAMQQMGYDAFTMGNHDFDGGLENFAEQLTHIQFPLVICNYDFTGTVMEHKYHPYYIFRKGGLKIGVTGIGIKLDGLVSADLSKGVTYQDPVVRSAEAAALLRSKGCDLVICLSHLGYEYPNDPERLSDVKLAASSADIDLIIGGHTHTFLDAPVSVMNKNGREVLIHQVGWGGIKMGRMDYVFSSVLPNKSLKKHQVLSIKKMTE